MYHFDSYIHMTLCECRHTCEVFGIVTVMGSDLASSSIQENTSKTLSCFCLPNYGTNVTLHHLMEITLAMIEVFLYLYDH